MGHVEVTRFAKGGTYVVPVLGGPATSEVTAKRGDVFLRPLRRVDSTRYGLFATDVPVVVPKRRYADDIVSILLKLLADSESPGRAEHRYVEPRWSMEKYAAHVESLADGSLQLSNMQGGSFVGEAIRLVVPVDRVVTDLPALLLEAMGERPEDVARLLGLRPPSNNKMQRTSHG